MTAFYLVRHGKKMHIAGDAPLSPAGRGEAHATARRLQGRPITRVYASPLRRARETAERIAAAHGLAVIDDARLRERANWGDLPGQSFAEFAVMWERTTHDQAYLPPVGDSSAQAGARLASFIRDAAHTDPHATIVAVTHGGLITDFLTQAFSEEELERWYPSFVANQSRLIAECSITVVECDGMRFTLTSFADTRHLT